MLSEWTVLASFLLCMACGRSPKNLHPVSVADFRKFVDETGYVTVAEEYGWSIVQVDIINFKTVDNATWRKPDGKNEPTSEALPVTQVAYNDALAYSKWSGQRLPTYDEYWDLIHQDTRIVVSDNILPISKIDSVNILGNVWEITSTRMGEEIRLAGGSYLCSVNTCNGTVKERALFVDKETGNTHIGFAVVE